MSEDAPIVIAHRGASGYLPEHTLPSKAMAYALGADYLEQDIVLSKDHVPIVLHDIHLDTVTNVFERYPHRHRSDGRFYAIDFTMQELKSLSVFERIDLETGRAVYSDRFPASVELRMTIPTLAEEIALTRGLNQSTGREVGIYPEVKQPAWHRKQGADISKIVLQVLSENGYNHCSSNAFFQCFDPIELKRVRTKLGAELKLVQLLGKGTQNGVDYDAMSTAEGLAQVATYANGIGPSIDRLIEWSGPNPVGPTRLVELAHKHGLKVHPYTLRRDSVPLGFESLDQLTELLLKSGVDGVFTDFPDLTRKKIRQQRSD